MAPSIRQTQWWAKFSSNFLSIGDSRRINCIPSTLTPEEYVIMLLRDELMNLHRKKWKRTTRKEYLALLGIVTNMGLIRKGSMKEYWNKTDWSQDAPSFSTAFTRDWFFQLQEVVQFPQIKGDSPKLRKVEAIVQHFSQQFQEYYVPEQQVSIDASLIDFEGRVGDLQPNICQTSITTGLDSSCYVYAKFQLATCIDFRYIKSKIKIAVNMVWLMIYV